MISVKAPGKLYIAGEYAVVENGIPAIIVAVDQYITANICATDKELGIIKSKQFNDDEIVWKRNDQGFITTCNDNSSFNYVISAIKMTDKYALLSGNAPKNFDINIDGSLTNGNGKKYGLGSSAAVTVATVKAVAALYDLKLNSMEIFKLSALSHLDVQGNGSLGDVASSSFGGWIAFSSFDKKWVKMHEDDLLFLMSNNWPDLMIKPLTPPDNLRLLIGWTGTPASTSNLLKNVKYNIDQSKYKNFLLESRECIHNMIKGFQNHNLNIIKSGIEKNREIINKLAQFTGIDIETSKLKNLCDIASQYDGAGKTSGAGGGDCGIVIIDCKKSVDDLEQEWKNNGIEPLHLKIHVDK